jgi:hypothetical protein
MRLNAENYYTREVDQYYMSASQFKAFFECESCALAIIKGEWTEEPTPPMQVGSYIDAYFSGSLCQFQAAHPELYKRDGSLKAEFEHANKIIERIRRDDLMMSYLSGNCQEIRTGTIAGVPFKTKMDYCQPDKHIVDLKIMRDFMPVWKDGSKVHFIEAWRYDYQAAIYQSIEGHHLPVIIAAASKEPEPDIVLLSIPQQRLNNCMKDIEYLAPHYQALKLRLVEPGRCEACSFCHATKVLTEVINYQEVMQ